MKTYLAKSFLRHVNKLYSNFHEHYFLMQALVTQKHIKEIIVNWQGKTIAELLAVRHSGAAHYYCAPNNQTAQLLTTIRQRDITRLLLHSDSYARCSDVFSEWTSAQTSRVMMVSHWQNQIANVGSLNTADIAAVEQLYQRVFSGNLSKKDQITNLREGGFGVKLVIDNHLVGVAQVALNNGNQAYVYGVAVAPEHRGKGYGRALMNGLMAKSNSKNLTLYLLTDNPVAIALYHSLGFSDKGNMLKLTYNG